MPEPHASIATGVVAGAGFAAPWWLFGADPGALIFGLITASFVSFGLTEINSRTRAACSVGLAGLLAGFGAPNAVAGIASYYPSVQITESSIPLLGIMIAIFTPKLVPILIEAAARIVPAILETAARLTGGSAK